MLKVESAIAMTTGQEENAISVSKYLMFSLKKFAFLAPLSLRLTLNDIVLIFNDFLWKQYFLFYPITPAILWFSFELANGNRLKCDQKFHLNSKICSSGVWNRYIVIEHQHNFYTIANITKNILYFQFCRVLIIRR